MAKITSPDDLTVEYGYGAISYSKKTTENGATLYELRKYLAEEWKKDAEKTKMEAMLFGQNLQDVREYGVGYKPKYLSKTLFDIVYKSTEKD